MDQLTPSNVPTYETKAEGRSLWDRCADRGLPVVAVREGERGYVVRYDLQHLDGQLSERALRKLREHVRSLRSYSVRVDPDSQTAGVGGETGHVAGELHAQTEDDARRLASHVSAFVFDDDNLV
ncbi:hypothetical protein HZS55_20610 [Halosimplex rubrum]|uniref:Uncharacterized protein n=1 Tax=Halosimplex rubrum TaxID=869889 RepID=A0A7D5P2T8_9EURY|nr:hypothetical protein [Halosimplex rubrum]QLH79546.1 hypothetical protein HZS55_20610 [Halosimplex rubrum]